MTRLLKKLWHDPVWSKVLAAVIFAACATAWAAIRGNLGVLWRSVIVSSPIPHWAIGLLTLATAVIALLHWVGRLRFQRLRDEFEMCNGKLVKSTQEVSRLAEELRTEKTSLRDCPQVIIKREEPTGKAVLIHNVSQTVDAFEVRMKPVEGQDVRLVAKNIPHLKAGETRLLELSAERTRKRAGLDLPARSEARVFFEEVANTNPFASAKVELNYHDVTAKKTCASIAEIVWVIWPESGFADVRFDKVSRI